MTLITSAPASESVNSRQNIQQFIPSTPDSLHAWIRMFLKFDIPRRPLVSGHDAPFDYICHAFFEDREPRDCIVWASRGGGKTQLGAIATLLDLVFKPGVQIRILGGSFEQSSKMYRYLKRMLDSEQFINCVKGNITGRFVELKNGSHVEVLSQSERSVRGQRVHKLRCDEVELFQPEIWEAAQMVTRSGQCGDVYVNASIETFSTMHRPFGLMQKLIRESRPNTRRLFRWNVLDTLQMCEPERSCETCPLWNECQGNAKHATGFFDIDDAIQQKHRIGEVTWKVEMLCEEPSRTDCVYPEFDARVHTFESRDVRVPDRHGDVSAHNVQFIAGIDFGFRDPTVLLFAFVHDDVVYVTDEIVQRECTTEEFIDLTNKCLALHNWPRPNWLGADPAGHQRSEHTGRSTISIWKKAGWAVRTRSLRIEPGIIAVRRRLKRADGTIGLRIHTRCETLIRSLKLYHYPSGSPKALLPVKDGHDHAADALRYLVVNLDRSEPRVRRREY